MKTNLQFRAICALSSYAYVIAGSLALQVNCFLQRAMSQDETQASIVDVMPDSFVALLPVFDPFSRGDSSPVWIQISTRERIPTPARFPGTRVPVRISKFGFPPS